MQQRLVGLAARSIPLVIPRAHDCITLFLGSKERYRQYFHANPAVYFKTTGWIERNERGELQQLSVQQRTGMDMSYEQLVEKYGEDNAQYIYEQVGDRTRNYQQITFIEMGVEPPMTALNSKARTRPQSAVGVLKRSRETCH